MNTLKKVALGMIGQLTPEPAQGNAPGAMELPPAQTTGGLPLMEALRQRHSERDFLPEAIAVQLLSNLLWAACGVNRATQDGRTAASAMNAQEVELYVAQPNGLYLYQPRIHALKLLLARDVRRVSGYQDFVDNAPLDLIMVADHARMRLIPVSRRASYAAVSAGAISQNIYLFCASSGLATVARGWFDRQVLARAIGLNPEQQIVLTQTVGYPRSPAAGGR